MAASLEDLGTTRQRVLEIIARERDELVALCVELGNTPSWHGEEREIAEMVAGWLVRAGIEAWLQPITDRSANVVGRIRGTADGPSLILDAHIDVGPPLPADVPERTRKIYGAWAEGDLLYGVGLINDKAQLAAFLIAARAILQAGVRLRGDLYVAGVAFETGWPSVGDRQGVNYPGEGFGTWWLFNRGVTADYALVGETSGFGLICAECGVLGLLVRTRGRDVYTPRMERGATLQEHPSALVRMAHLVQALEEWAVQYERSCAVDTSAGRIVPKAQVLRTHGGPDETIVQMDIRLVPRANPRAIQRDVHAFLRARGFECELEAIQWSRGYVADGAQELIDAVTASHQAVFGAPPPPPPTPEISMWRDVNMFNEVGIPSICYGPPRHPEPYSDPGNRAMKIDDLVAATKVYALTALTICNG